MNSAVHPAFSLLSSQPVPAMNIWVEEYSTLKPVPSIFTFAPTTRKTFFSRPAHSAQRFHRRGPHSRTYRALWQPTLPGAGPVFMMTRRSLNTFMNAFTSSDWTAYPFASINRKDFSNLLGVYLDAVFSPAWTRWILPKKATGWNLAKRATPTRN